MKKLITLIDDENQEHEFEIIDELENDDGHFMALVPTQQEPEEMARIFSLPARPYRATQ